MKFRNGFVSNSSSSSFVVISTTGTELEIPDSLIKFNTVLELGTAAGETEFGWSPHEYYDIGSKLNLAWILTEYSVDAETTEERLNMLKSVINKKYPRSVNFINFEEDINAYVDHQSIDDMMSIYDDEQSLYDFIFNSSSYIVTDNDNH